MFLYRLTDFQGNKYLEREILNKYECECGWGLLTTGLKLGVEQAIELFEESFIGNFRVLIMVTELPPNDEFLPSDKHALDALNIHPLLIVGNWETVSWEDDFYGFRRIVGEEPVRVIQMSDFNVYNNLFSTKSYCP